MTELQLTGAPQRYAPYPTAARPWRRSLAQHAFANNPIRGENLSGFGPAAVVQSGNSAKPAGLEDFWTRLQSSLILPLAKSGIKSLEQLRRLRTIDLSRIMDYDVFNKHREMLVELLRMPAPRCFQVYRIAVT